MTDLINHHELELALHLSYGKLFVHAVTAG
jgi:hypothetical protein